MFIKEIEEALAEGRIDLAVHSLKDLPTELSDQFTIAAIPAREDPRDAFCAVAFFSIDDLPEGARVGTSSLRREAQLKALRRDVQVHPLRGNVDTRLRKLQSGEYDAIILAVAGLKRLNRTELVRQVLLVELMCPAAGQGALAIETRAGDQNIIAALSFLEDAAARSETDCERALLQAMGGGCQVPIGANATVGDNILHLEGVVASADGTRVLRESGNGSDARELGRRAAMRLLQQGGEGILRTILDETVAIPEQP